MTAPVRRVAVVHGAGPATDTAVPSWLCNGSVNKGLGPVTAVAYNHYANRVGHAMPTTLRYTESKRPAGVSHFLAWETLTHANNPN